MKVLVSAFSCHPLYGSESGTGWRWALGIHRLGHEVWVLTEGANRPAIESAIAGRADMHLQFHYYDLPRWIRPLGGTRWGQYLSYLVWQWGAYRLARRLHMQEGFDLVHHVTWGVIRQPSFMGRLGIPFILGPLGGGERAPWRLRRAYSVQGWFWDALRDAANFAVRFDPMMHDTFARAAKIYVKTPASLDVIPHRYRSKVTCYLEVGTEPPPEFIIRGQDQCDEHSLRVLCVGRFLHWKGIDLGLPAFAELLRSGCDGHLTLIGRGPEEDRWRALADRLGLTGKVSWIPWLSHDELLARYPHYDVLLFPSLHDSSGYTVLEALAHGLPVVCLDLGGPAAIVDDRCARVICTRRASTTDVIAMLSDALRELAAKPELRRTLSRGALARAREFEWPRRVAGLYTHVGDRS